jgi:hypothetical protein
VDGVVLRFFREEPGVFVLDVYLHRGGALAVVDLKDGFVGHIDFAAGGADPEGDHLLVVALDLPSLKLETSLERLGDDDGRAIFDDFG